MTLLMVNAEDMYNFETVEDAFLWIHLHRTDEEILILGEDDEQGEEVKAYLNAMAPIEITEI